MLQRKARSEAASVADEACARDNDTRIQPPRYILWSANEIDLADQFQRRHFIRQVLLHRRMTDIRTLDLSKVAALLGELRLPPAIHSLWERFLSEQGYAQG